MTAKLIKHEYLRTRGIVSLILGIALATGALGIVMGLTGFPIISQIGILLWVLAAVLVIPATQLFLGINYWFNGYREQGYFTQMLPVKGSVIYWAKLVWGMAISVVALAVAAAVFFVGLFALDFFPIVREGWEQTVGIVPGWLWALVVTMSVFYLFYLLIALYFVATLGSSEPLNRWGIGGPIVVGIVTYMIVQILTVLSMLLIPVAITGIGGGSLELGTYGLSSIFGIEAANFVPIGWLPIIFIFPIVMVTWTAISWNKGASLN